MQKQELSWREVLEIRIDETQRAIDEGKVSRGNLWIIERNLKFNRDLLSILDKGKPIRFKHTALSTLE